MIFHGWHPCRDRHGGCSGCVVDVFSNVTGWGIAVTHPKEPNRAAVSRVFVFVCCGPDEACEPFCTIRVRGTTALTLLKFWLFVRRFSFVLRFNCWRSWCIAIVHGFHAFAFTAWNFFGSFTFETLQSPPAVVVGLTRSFAHSIAVVWFLYDNNVVIAWSVAVIHPLVIVPRAATGIFSHVIGGSLKAHETWKAIQVRLASSFALS